MALQRRSGILPLKKLEKLLRAQVLPRMGDTFDRQHIGLGVDVSFAVIACRPHLYGGCGQNSQGQDGQRNHELNQSGTGLAPIKAIQRGHKGFPFRY